MQSVLEILQKCSDYFASKGIESPKFDAETLLAHSLGCKRLELFLRFEEPLPEAKLAPFRELVKRRAKREPLQHILGFVDFFGLRLKCDSRALVPRNETEELCEIATEKLCPNRSAPLDILDLGTGSGAIALAMSSAYPNASVDAAELSDAAISLASENAQSLGLKISIIKSDWFENIEKSYDIGEPALFDRRRSCPSATRSEGFRPASRTSLARRRFARPAHDSLAGRRAFEGRRDNRLRMRAWAARNPLARSCRKIRLCVRRNASRPLEAHKIFNLQKIT